MHVANHPSLRGTPVKVTVVFPGGVRTGIARNSRIAQNGEPIRDVDAAVRSFEARQRLSPAQAALKFHAEKLGHAVHVVRSMEEFLKLV